MKWTRSKTGTKEYSTGYIGLRHYISVGHIENYELFDYVYSKNGERIIAGYINANGWDEAEQAVASMIQKELSYQAKRWNMLLNDFNDEVNVNETLG